MEIPEKIKRLNREQLDSIVEARRATNLIPWLAVNAKARTACSLRHPGWMEESNAYVNAIIQTSIRLRLQNTLTLATLISAFESMAYGIIAKRDLTLDEYDLIMSPVLFIFPELIVAEQDWTPEPIDEDLRHRPRVTYQTPPIDVKEKKGRPYRRVEDLETAVEEETFDASSLMESLKPKPKATSKDDALKAMLSKMTKSVDPQPLVKEEDAPFTEEVLKPDPNPSDSRLRSLKVVTDQGKFKLQDQETGEYFGGEFSAPIEAIIWAAKNGMKIK